MVLLMAITTMLCARVSGLMVGHDARNNCNGVLVVKAAGSQLSHGVPWLRATATLQTSSIKYRHTRSIVIPALLPHLQLGLPYTSNKNCMQISHFNHTGMT